MSATPDNTLTDSEQLIADLQRQLAECRAERDEALRRETATAEVLQVINSSPSDLAPVFDAILENAHKVCGAALGSLGVFEGDMWRAVVQRGYGEPLASALRQGGRGSDNPLLQELIDGAPFVHLADLALLDLPIARANVAAGIRALLVVALRKDDAPLGTISIARREPRPFSDKEIALLENFAAQAVIAMENARLLGELHARTFDLEEALEYQTATSDVLNVISRSTADVQPVLDTVIETAVRLCSADSGSTWIRDGEVYRNMAFSAAYQTEPEYWAFARQLTMIPSRDSMAGRVALEGRVVHVADISADPDYAWPGVVASGRRSMLGVPLLREGAVLGTIVLSRKRVEPFTERQIELVRTLPTRRYSRSRTRGY